MFKISPKKIIKQLARRILAKPSTKRMALLLLNRVPAIKLRLQRILFNVPVQKKLYEQDLSTQSKSVFLKIHQAINEDAS